MPTQIFVSSVQAEFEAERRAIKDYVHGDPFLSQHFRVFIFEDVAAQDRTPRDIYLNEVDRSSVYVGLFGSQYGFEDSDGISPTHHEFDRAVAKRLERLIFLRSAVDVTRHEKMVALVNKAQAQLTRRTFVAVADLCAQLYASLIRILERDGLIASRPFDARSARVPLSALEQRNIAEFTARASTARNFSFKVEAGTRDTLAHLSLLEGEDPCNAAVILFSADPKRVIRGAFVNCMHFPGLEPVKPALSQNVFDGPLFRQIEESLSFVMSRLSSPVGTRDNSARLEVESELPKAAVIEAIVNALAHRDYASPAPVQVRLFADRLEVSNPGELPRSLTPEHLRRTHPSIPANPLLSEVLFLMGYIDRAGTGTLDMLAKCRDANLPVA